MQRVHAIYVVLVCVLEPVTFCCLHTAPVELDIKLHVNTSISLNNCSRYHSGMGKKDDPSLMHQWLKLVQEKNALVRYESELMIL